MTFWPSDPKWPQLDIWPHNIGRGSQADQHVWVLWSFYVTWTSYSILGKIAFDPCDPTWNWMIFFKVISFVEGVKLMHIHELRDLTLLSVGGVAF